MRNPTFIDMIDFLNDDHLDKHPRIRRSLFPNVPPYIHFAIKNSDPLPNNIQSLMRWKESKITPVVVRRVVKNTGFHILEECNCWSGTWGNQVRSTDFKKFHDHQKFNHFPCTYHIGRKDFLWKNIKRMQVRYGDRKFDIAPPTFILPEEKKLFKQTWEKSRPNQCWILKPPACYRGEGINIVNKMKNIPKNDPMVVQHYIHNPYLINGTKFDLRLYVLVTSINPLKLYLYDDGLARFASVKYSYGMHNLGDRFMHLTNYSVNKDNEKYVSNSDTEAHKGHKWSLQALWRYLAEVKKVDVIKIQQDIKDLVIKTMISVEEPLNIATQNNLRSKYNAYELFGFDVILDSNLRPWLLEVNISPSLHSSSPLDVAIKLPLVQNILNMVGFHIPISKKLTEKQIAQLLGEPADQRMCLDSRMYTAIVSNHEKFKHYSIMSKKRKGNYHNAILEELTPEDVRHLIIYEDELNQLGNFTKLFPTKHTNKYFKYFRTLSYYNMLLDAWETMYSRDRENGINRLRELCKQGVHLKIGKSSSIY